MLLVDGQVSRSEAVDKWVGTLTGTVNGVTATFDFIVFVNPGVSASFEWRFRNTLLASGPLAATVSGSRVSGIMFFTGGLIAQDPLCCTPCTFSGQIVGNTASGTASKDQCGGDVDSTWQLTKT
jgi:hypothetical protein